MKYFQDNSLTNPNGIANKVANVFANEIELVLKRNQEKNEFFSAFCADFPRNGLSIIQNQDIEETPVQFSTFQIIATNGSPATIEQVADIGLSDYLNVKQLQVFYSLGQQQSLLKSLYEPILKHYIPMNVLPNFSPFNKLFLDVTNPRSPKMRITNLPIAVKIADSSITQLGTFVITVDLAEITNDTILYQKPDTINEKSDIGNIDVVTRYIPKVETSFALTTKQSQDLTAIWAPNDLGKEISKKQWFDQNKSVVIADIQGIHDRPNSSSDIKTQIKEYLLAIGTPEKKVDAIAGNIDANLNTPDWLAITGFSQIYEANVAKGNFLTPLLGAFGFTTLGATGGAAAVATFAATTALGAALAPIIAPVVVGGAVVGAGALGAAAVSKVVEERENEKEKQKQTGNLVVMQL